MNQKRTYKQYPDAGSEFPDSERDRSYFRQFFHDMRLNEKIINEVHQQAILGDSGVQNKKYTWYFQKFDDRPSSKSPTSTDERNAREWLCKVPTSGGNLRKLYRYNFKGTQQIQVRIAKPIKAVFFYAIPKVILRKYLLNMQINLM